MFMKLGITGDFHLGFGEGEIYEDAFRQAEEALRICEERSDLIIIAGDIFHHRVPKQEVWGRALALFRKVNKPIVAIHGTHERRSPEAMNVIKALENGGFLKHLHCESYKYGNTNIYGISGVPENMAKKVFELAKPVPESGCFNVFVFHQSLKEYLPFEETFLSISDLPKGFDLYVTGHIHKPDFIQEIPLIITGSTVITQETKGEAEKSKGVFIYDTETRTVEFVPLETQRPFYYVELELKHATPTEIIQKVRYEIEQILSNKHELKPRVKISLKGNLKPGYENTHISEKDLVEGFENMAIIRISLELFKEKLEELRKIQKEKMSVKDIGTNILKKLIENTDYKGPDVEETVDLLAEGNVDTLINRILSSIENESENNHKEPSKQVRLF